MDVVRFMLAIMQCVAIAGCGWAIGLMMERYGPHSGVRRRPLSLWYLGVAIALNALILATLAARGG